MLGMKLSKFFLIVSMLLFVTSCTPENWTSLEIVERQLTFPPGYYNHLVYLDGKIIGFAQDSNAPKEKQVSFAYEGETERTIFLPEDDPRCKRYTLFNVVGLLPDGRLGLFKECKKDEALTATRAIYAYDWHSGKLQQLVVSQIPFWGPKDFTWNPEMTLGIQETTGSYRGTIYWIAPDGTSPMDIEIENRGLTWNLKDYLEGKEKTGLVVAPSWSLDGKRIAFFVSTYGILEEPRPKFNVNYDLFFMDPVKLEPKLELMDVADAGNIVWSPNNENLMFRGCIGRRLICGLWRYKIADKSLALIKEGEFADYIWITNEKIAAAKNIELPYNDNEIWEYSISG